MDYVNTYSRVGRRRVARTAAITTLIAGMLLIAGGLATLSAEQITTVGIVDIDRVYNAFYRDSTQVRDLERLRREYQLEINQQVRELEALRDRRLAARESGNETTAARLDAEILSLQTFLQDLTTRRRQQLEASQAELLSNDFLQQLQSAIEFVAESEGFTIVLRTDTAGLQWWSAEVDISDRVLQRLIQVASR